MAKMHSRGRGRSGSTRPAEKKVPSWSRYKAKEVEKLVLKLAKEGKSSSEIGIHLRDTYGVPSFRVASGGKRIYTLLREKEMVKELPEDLLNLMKKSIKIRKHLEANRMDQTVKRGLILTESKIRRLIKYYNRQKRLPAGSKYDSTQLKIYVQ